MVESRILLTACVYPVPEHARRTFTPAHVGRHVSLAFASTSVCHGQEEAARKTAGKKENRGEV